MWYPRYSCFFLKKTMLMKLAILEVAIIATYKIKK